jgi:glycine/D-amino acid oxidase-like deaminating enzyme
MKTYFAAVFGAGVSGTAVAGALSERGKSVLLIDPNVSEDAPGPPAALVNPATGRHARLSWNSPECMELLRKRVDQLISYSGRSDLISDSGVLRPAVNEKLAEGFREALEKYDWPEGWMRWVDGKEIEAISPYADSRFGGLWLDCGFTVFVDNYLNTYRRFLRETAVMPFYLKKASFSPDLSGFRIEGDDGFTASAEHVIIAAGHQTPFFPEWDYLPLHRVKGQIVAWEADHDLDWEHGISAMGYSLRRGKRTIVTGSTYEHRFTDLSTTDHAEKQIERKLETMLPGLKGRFNKTLQLAGVRVTTPDKLPVTGRHPENPALCICTGMGSKGFLYSEYTAQQLAAHLAEDSPVKEEISTSRFE